MAEATPVIIRRKKGRHGGHHGGAWKVAYADFVTALMSLFIVLWLMNTSKPIQKAVGGYFRDPLGFSKNPGNGQQGAGEYLTVSKDNMGQLKEALQTVIRKAQTFDKLKDQVEMTVTSEGLRIELLESETGTFFNTGNAQPSDQGRELLLRLATELGKLPNRISLEGHTDARPFAGGGQYGNWELSADRANAARRLMQENGLTAGQVVQIRGYADRRLRKPQTPNDASNRRISVIVQYVPENGEQGSAGGSRAGG